MSSREEILNGLADAVVGGKQDLAVELANKAIEEGIDAYEAIMQGCAHGMSIVSEKYDKREMFVPHIMMSARAMNSAVEVLQPHVNVETVPGDALFEFGRESRNASVLVGDVPDQPSGHGQVIPCIFDGTGEELDLQLFGLLSPDLLRIASHAFHVAHLAVCILDSPRDLGDMVDHFVQEPACFDER